MVAIWLLFYTKWKGSEKGLLIQSTPNLFYRISKKAGYPVQHKYYIFTF